ncbi:MAG: U32 family peptidase, partial [Myxococcales bacterium]|nr:U32 family peptidase [Myxococcales bacterium]
MARPEILAPAGDRRTLRAALAAGADAVYFGLADGFNARARAESIDRATLPEVVAEVHRAGARAYLTLNTLVFERELPAVEAILRDVAAAGVDALIVQDPAVALLARSICPDIELHASTQMTISSAEGVRFAAALGATRVVLPRELSTKEIGRLIDAAPAIETEVFVHGALCVSWSGQCLTSEAWGGRSANRGQCAQSCRMPYDLYIDGAHRPLGEVRYLLSPKDLAAFRALPALAALGVHTLKIEGRYKGPAYVVAAVEAYRRFVEALCRPGGATEADFARVADDLRDLELVYSRGFSDGFLGGADHQHLVEGRFPKHRGLLLGRVVRVEGQAVLVEPHPDGRPRSGG